MVPSCTAILLPLALLSASVPASGLDIFDAVLNGDVDAVKAQLARHRELAELLRRSGGRD